MLAQLAILAVAARAVLADDLSTVFERRIPFVVQSIPNATALPESIPVWLATLNSTGLWPDVDYTSGCPAQRANWPIQSHWQRIVAQAAVYIGAFPDDALQPYINNATTLNQTKTAMDWWFANDFTVRDCLDNGGAGACPCGTPGLWNTNWFSNVILIPKLIGQTCVLLFDQLSTDELDACARITARSFSTFDEVPAPSFLSGANILDIASIGVASGLFSANASLVSDAFGKINAEIVVHPQIKVDGIKPDGGFQQHVGVLYNGNYGKDYTNDGIELATESAGTQWASTAESQAALTMLINGSSWTMYQNVETGVLHYDFSVLGRFIAFAVSDVGATVAVSSILINVTQIEQLGELWNEPELVNIADLLEKPTGTANIGGFQGNRMYWFNDYMVHRGPNFITTLKMFSTRTTNTECVNLANPLGFHLSDGTVYTHIDGSEYEDIAGAWDWNLIPGTTTDYGGTPLSCATAGQTGLESWVGGVSDGTRGMGVMKYLNPITQALSWQKAWVFTDTGAQHVMVNSIVSTNAGLDVYSVLDQRRHNGTIFLDGAPVTSGNHTLHGSGHTLFHGGVGYAFGVLPAGAQLDIQVGEKTGDWGAIGTSTAGIETVDLFAAFVHHPAADVSAPVSYTAFPGIASQRALEQKVEEAGINELANDGNATAVWDSRSGVLYAAFWSADQQVTVPGLLGLGLKVSTDAPAALIVNLEGLNLNKWTVTAADPGQSLAGVNVTFAIAESLPGNLDLPEAWGKKLERIVAIAFPSGPDAGRSITVPLL